LSGLFVSSLWFLLLFGGGIFLAYRRVNLLNATIATGLALIAYSIFTFTGGPGWVWLWLIVLWLAFGLMVGANLVGLRREKITRRLLEEYRKMLPSMSDTEREALEAGNVWWDGELFSGKPDWNKLMSFPAPKLSDEEQAFLDGPCEELCRICEAGKS